MKKIISAIVLSVLTFFMNSQTAVNFNCNDCSGNNHDLFTKLNAGKVVVIAWVMPCATCLAPALAAQTAVQSYSISNPGQVLYYVVDDYANTACVSLTGWCNSNGLTNASVFSNSVINMADYGISGMPKIIVVGDGNHTVYYNQNGASSVSQIQNAINSALAVIATNLKESENSNINSLGIYPNPTNSNSVLNFNVTQDSKVKIEVRNILGQIVSEVYDGVLQKGDQSISINTNNLIPGNYFVSFSSGEYSKNLKLIIVR